MIRLNVRDVLDSTGAELVRGDLERPLWGVSTDTRTLRPGALWFALSGPRFDGNLFAREALEKGAGALVLKHPGDAPASVLSELAGDAALALLPGDAPIALVPDPRRALRDLGAWHRERLELPVIGITGSCGKTTTKDLVAQLLATRYEVVSSPRSFNNEVGVPLTLLQADERTQVIVSEIGTSGPGEIGSLCRVARPNVGVLTNVGRAHLAGLGSLEGVAMEKADLVAAIPRDGFVVLNADCRFTPLVASYACAPVTTFSIDGDGDLNATDLWFHSGGTTFQLGGHQIDSPLLGTHNVQNLLAALAVCRGLGLALDELLPAVALLRAGSQRLERRRLGGLTLLDDSWNANPDSARAAVRCLAGMDGYGRRVLVLGDMLELGVFAAEMHHRIGEEVASAGIDLFLPVGGLAKAAAAGALSGGMRPESVVHLGDADEAIRAVPELLREGDVVLVKGSRGMALERLVAKLADRFGLADVTLESQPKAAPRRAPEVVRGA